MSIRKIIIYLFIFLFSFRLVSQNADVDMLRTLNSGDNAGWDETMKYTSLSVYPFMVITPATILIAGYVKKDKVMIRNGYKTAIAICLSAALAQGMKYTIQRERPFNEYPLVITKRSDASGYSFPSGHTTCAFATATSLTLSTKKWYVAVPAFTYAGLVAYSRMRLGVHYPSDVLGGIVTGVGSALLTWQIDKWMQKKKEKIPSVN